MCPMSWQTEDTTSLWYLAKNMESQPNHEKADKPKLKYTLQNND